MADRTNWFDPVFIFLDLKIMCGEYEFHAKSVDEIDFADYQRSEEKYANDKASSFYDGQVIEFGDKVFSYHTGEVMVSVEKVQLLSTQEYNILKKYL